MALTSTHVHAIVQATFARATLTDSGCIDRDSFHVRIKMMQHS